MNHPEIEIKKERRCRMELRKDYIVELLRASGVGIDEDATVHLYSENGISMISWTTTERSTFQASNAARVPNMLEAVRDDLKRKD